MNTAEDPSLRPPPAGGLSRLAGSTGLYRIPVYAVATLLALAVAWALGRDLTWDTLNYHVYAGFSAFHDRFSQDYFAAGIQSYFNPYVYAPFYTLLRAGASALLIGTLLALLHAAILWLTFELAVLVSPLARPGVRIGIGVCAVALGLANPLLLQELGSPDADIVTAELALAGWVLLAAVVRQPRAALLIAAATLLGAATALKLTNAIHAIAAGAVLLWVPLPLKGRLRYLAIYSVAVSLAFGLIAAPWAYRLGQAFGNPLFPLLNNVFHSAQFTLEPLRFVRFIPTSLTDALWRPFRMLDPSPMVHDELRAPDARYALLAILVCGLAMRRLWRGLATSAASPGPRASLDLRCVAALGCGLAVDWALWLIGSGNSRYFMPMACVAAVLVVTLLVLLSDARGEVWVPIMILVCTLQVFQMWSNPGLRWDPVPWDRGPWLSVDVPKNLATDRALYLTMGAMSSSYLAPYVEPQSGFVNFTGYYALGLRGASGAHLEALLQRYAGHVRVLVEGEHLYTDLRHLPNVQDVDGALWRFGLRADPDDCSRIAVQGATGRLHTLDLVSCRAVPDSSRNPERVARKDLMDVILDRVEDACPALLQPRRPLTEYRNGRWQRVYLNTDVIAWVSRGWVKLENPVTHDGPIFLGSEAEWTAGPLPVACGRSDGHDFARVLPATARSSPHAPRDAARIGRR